MEERSARGNERCRWRECTCGALPRCMPANEALEARASERRLSCFPNASDPSPLPCFCTACFMFLSHIIYTIFYHINTRTGTDTHCPCALHHWPTHHIHKPI